MRVIVLQTALFGQDAVIEEALRCLGGTQAVSRYDLRGVPPSAETCDAVIAAVCAADAVITV